VIDYTPIGEVCYTGSSKQTNPFDIVCVPSEMNGILAMTDPDAGVLKVNLAWGTNCGIKAYALFDEFCFATCAQCKNGYLIADSSTGGSSIFEGFYADIPPGGQLICGVTVNGASFTDFGNNTSYIENPNLPAPRSCNYNTPDLFDATATVTSVFGPGPWSTPQQQEALKLLWHKLVDIETAAIALFNKYPQGNTGFAYVASVLAVTMAFDRIASGQDPPDPNYTTVASVSPPNLDLTGVPPAAAQLVQTLEQTVGVLNAIITTTNRATGAYLNGDANSQALQQSALPGFETQLANVAAQLPTLFAAWGQELVAEGVDPRTIALTDVTAAQQNIADNGFPSSVQTELTNLGLDQTTIQQAQTLIAEADPQRAFEVLQNLFQVGPLMPPVLPAASNLQLYAAVLPASRSVQVGSAATAFATLINAGASTATSCGIAPNSPLPLSFVYQATNPATNALIGTPNTPVDIPAGASQSFVISLTPTAALPPVYANFAFFCANANVAPQSDGIDALLLSGSANPTPDIVALAASGDPGIVDIPGATGTGAFAVATANAGAAATITAVADTGGVALPISINVCQTDPSTGACMKTPAPTVTTTINTGDTPTFGVFVSGSGAVPFDPANNRVFVRFNEFGSGLGSVPRGATSLAVRTH
jgi:hypothetical protein